MAYWMQNARTYYQVKIDRCRYWQYFLSTPTFLAHIERCPQSILFCPSVHQGCFEPPIWTDGPPQNSFNGNWIQWLFGLASVYFDCFWWVIGLEEVCSTKSKVSNKRFPNIYKVSVLRIIYLYCHLRYYSNGIRHNINFIHFYELFPSLEMVKIVCKWSFMVHKSTYHKITSYWFNKWNTDTKCHKIPTELTEFISKIC